MELFLKSCEGDLLSFVKIQGGGRGRMVNLVDMEGLIVVEGGVKMDSVVFA